MTIIAYERSNFKPFRGVTPSVWLFWCNFIDCQTENGWKCRNHAFLRIATLHISHKENGQAIDFLKKQKTDGLIKCMPFCPATIEYPPEQTGQQSLEKNRSSKNNRAANHRRQSR